MFELVVARAFKDRWSEAKSWPIFTQVLAALAKIIGLYRSIILSITFYACYPCLNHKKVVGLTAGYISTRAAAPPYPYETRSSPRSRLVTPAWLQSLGAFAAKGTSALIATRRLDCGR